MTARDRLRQIVNEVIGNNIGYFKDEKGILLDFEDAILQDFILKSDVQRVINEIVEEINSRSQYSNIGKKGCVTRLMAILKPTKRLRKK